MNRQVVLGVVVLVAGLARTPPGSAQSSVSHRLEGSTFNEGGRPSGGLVAQSASHRITLDAVGDLGGGLAASSPSFGLSVGITGAYAPPSEVQDVSFKGPTQFAWPGMPTAVRFNVYRGGTSQLPGTFGSCLAANLTSGGYTDTVTPAARAGFYYLVTGENRLFEEGTKGYQSNGTPRTASPACP